MKVSLQIGNLAQRFLSTDVIFYALYQFLIAVNGNSHLKLSAVIGGQGGEVDIKNKLGNIAVGSKNRQLSIMLTQILLHCVDRYPFDCFGGGGADRVGSGFTGNRLRHSGRGSGQVGNGQHKGGDDAYRSQSRTGHQYIFLQNSSPFLLMMPAGV